MQLHDRQPTRRAARRSSSTAATASNDVAARLEAPRAGTRVCSCTRTRTSITSATSDGCAELTRGKAAAASGGSAALPDARAAGDLARGPQAPPIVALDGELRDGDVAARGRAAARGPAHARPHAGQRLLRRSRAGAHDASDRRHALRGFHRPLGSRRHLDGRYRRARSETKLLPYADATPVVPGHGPATTIGIERRTNPYLLG